tara:strand:+ start:1334 stop:1786 length:453 start_codon:yes stop_codon:yes gene_type:complete
MQRSSANSGMGSALAGGAAEQAFGGETDNVLTKITVYGTIAFFILCFGLYISFQAGIGQKDKNTDATAIMEGYAAEKETVAPDSASEETVTPVEQATVEAVESVEKAVEDAIENIKKIDATATAVQTEATQAISDINAKAESVEALPVAK